MHPPSCDCALLDTFDAESIDVDEAGASDVSALRGGHHVLVCEAHLHSLLDELSKSKEERDKFMAANRDLCSSIIVLQEQVACAESLCEHAWWQAWQQPFAMDVDNPTFVDAEGPRDSLAKMAEQFDTLEQKVDRMA
eukprot:7803232-Karenia_brevis.AAC.1